MKIPDSCIDVKCMQSGCKNGANHKVGEQNVWDSQTEPEEYKQFNSRHEFTTYLCDEHFKKLMLREEFYGNINNYKSTL